MQYSVTGGRIFASRIKLKKNIMDARTNLHSYTLTP